MLSSAPPAIVVGRTLSAYTVPDIQNNQETITYTAYNTTADTLTGVALTTTLQSGVTFSGGSPTPAQSGQQLSWSLGTLAPFASASVQLTVTLANPIPTQLDGGASAAGVDNGTAVSDTTAPATLRTDTIAADLLASTPDANAGDPYIQEEAAELDYDPQQIFAFLQSDIGYNSYDGSLRGARGTLWSGVGNSLDVASLGVALMRASGIPAQYAQGTLPENLAQQLILSMFPNPQVVVGLVPQSAGTASPANDFQLLSETTNHYWFQFDTGSGMQDADPLIAGATIGKAFAPNPTTFSEVPDADRVKVEIQLNAEITDTASALFGLPAPQTTTVLDQTFNTVDLVGKALSVGNFVSTSSGGFIFTATTNTYTPYIAIGDEGGDLSQEEVIQGTSYQEVLTNFPLGSQVLTGLFLNINVTGPNVPEQSYERTLVDRIGFAVRQNGGTPNSTIDPSAPPIIGPTDILTISALPGLQSPIPATPLNAQLQQISAQVTALGSTTAGQQSPQFLSLTEELTIGIEQLQLINFLTASDLSTAELAARGLVKAYYDSPRITIVSSTTTANPGSQTGTTSYAIDLRGDNIRVIEYPGQNSTAHITFNTVYGFAENFLESQIMGLLAAPNGPQGTGINTFAIFQAAMAQGIGFATITSQNLNELDALSISADAKARITLSVAAGNQVLVPEQSVQIDGESTVGWYETNPTTGVTVGVTEDGGHQNIVDFSGLLILVGFLVVVVLPTAFAGTAALQALQKLNSTTDPKARQALIQQIINDFATSHDLFTGLVAFFAITELRLNAPGLIPSTNPDPPLGDMLLSPAPLGVFGGLTGTNVAAAVAPDPVFTLPFDGAQLPTFRVGITNFESTADTFALSVPNVPAGFTAETSVSQITIPAGGTAEVGVYLVPTSTIPQPGTVVPFSVQVTSTTTATITTTANESFTVPAIDAVTLTSSPASLSTTPGAPVSATLTATNVGNVAENVTLTSTLPAGLTASSPAPLALNPGQSATATITLTPDPSTPLNTTLQPTVTATYGPSSAPLTTALMIPVEVAAPGVQAIAAAAVAAEQLTGSSLSGQLTDLSTALTNLYQAPTNAVYAGQAQAAITSLISQLTGDPFLSGFTSGFTTAQGALAAATTAAEVQSALAGLGTELTSLAGVITDDAAHGFNLALSPDVAIVQPGAPETFDLVMTNTGSAATTYDLSVKVPGMPAGVTASFSQMSVTLQPGAAIGPGNNPVTLTLTESGTTLVATTFTVTATAEGASEITLSTLGQLTLRSESILVAGVSTNPAFTSAGGQVAVSAQVQATVNEPTQVLASYQVAGPGPTGKILFASVPVPVSLAVASAVTTVPLGTLDTTGFLDGTDTIFVTLANASGQPIPGATAVGTLVIGSPVTGTLTTTPALVPTGTSTVTSTVQINTATAYPPPLTLQGAVGTPAPGTSVALYQSGTTTYAYESGTGGIDALDVTDPANPKFLESFGMNDITNGQFGFNVAKVVNGELLVGTTNGNNGSVFNLLVYSLANPAAPTLVSNTTINYRFLSDLLVNSTGTAVYVPTNGFLYSFGSIFQKFGDLVAVDLTDPTMPALASALFTNEGQPDGGDMSEFGGTLVNDGLAYITGLAPGGGDVSSNTGNLLVVNVANPANMSVITSLNIPGTINLVNVAVQGDRALVVGTAGTESTSVNLSATGVANNLTLTVLDISNPDDPTILGSTLVTNEQYPFGEAGQKTDVVSLGNGDFAISDNDTGGNPSLLVVDPSDPSNIIVSSAQVPSGVHGITVSGDELYASTSSGLSVYQIGQLVSDPVVITVNLPAGTAANIVPGSYNVAPTQVNTAATGDSLIWDRTFAAGNTSYTFSWQTTLSNVTAGESIPVTVSATASFTTMGTPGETTLPGTSVTGVPIVAVTPATATAPPGGTATYDVRLTNPTAAQVTYFANVTNFSGDATDDLASGVTIPAQGSVDEPLTFTVDSAAVTGMFPFTVSVSDSQNDASGTATAALNIAGTPVVQPNPNAYGVVVGLSPAAVTAGQGMDAFTTVQLTNTGTTDDSFILKTTGLPMGVNAEFTENGLFQFGIDVPQGASNFREATLTFTVAPGTAPGVYPFQVVATSEGDSAVTGAASGTLTVVANGVQVSLSPTSGAPGSAFQLMVTNTGTVTDTFNLALAGPAAAVASLGQDQVMLSPGNSQVVPITTTAVNFALPEDLDLTGYATSQTNPAVQDASAAVLVVPATQGLTAALTPAAQALPTPGTTSFVVMVTNTGNTEGIYTATIVGTSGPVTASLMGLNGQPTQTISSFYLPGLATGALVIEADIAATGSGTITVLVQSTTNPSETAMVTAAITAGAAPQTMPTMPAVVNGDGPQIADVQRFGFHEQPTSVVLTFNEPLDPAEADNPHNYLILNMGGRGLKGHDLVDPIAVRKAVYNPATDAVTLLPAQRLDVHNRYELIVIGTPGGLEDLSGRLLDGAATGVPGSDFKTVISFNTLAGPSPLMPAKELRPLEKEWARIEAHREKALGAAAAHREAAAAHRADGAGRHDHRHPR